MASILSLHPQSGLAAKAFLLLSYGCSVAMPQDAVLSRRNLDAPFCYVRGGPRTWPVFQRALPEAGSVRLAAVRKGEMVAEGDELRFPGFHVSLSREGKLEIVSDPDGPAMAFELQVAVSLPGRPDDSQKLEVRPAPPGRPISYIADFGDDIIRMFLDYSTGKYRPVTKAGFDQYFRRLQAQGIGRLIVWLTPFPLVADPNSYSKEDWGRYEGQARAIIDGEAVTAVLEQAARNARNWGHFTHWGWIRELMALRLRRDFGPMLCDSALEHGIKLTISFRPFEAALTKYYEIPAFDTGGEFLWGFLPLATPAVNYHPDQVCFAHYRTILDAMGHGDRGRIGSIEMTGAKDATAFLRRFEATGDNLRIAAADFPPLQEDSFILHRQNDGDFVARPYREIQQDAQRHLEPVSGFSVREDGEGTVRITGLQVPSNRRYLLLSNPSADTAALDFDARSPVTLRSKAGNRLGHVNVYWVLEGSDQEHTQTRVAGIPSHGEQHSEFDATKASRKLLADGPGRISLLNRMLVIDLGQPWSVEMMDLNQAAARKNVLAELKTLLRYPAVDEIFVNTRSHTALISYIDLGYAPRAAAYDPRLKELAADTETVEGLTTSPRGYWDGACQSPDSPRRWRYARNREVANGVRELLLDLQGAFPETRIRMVMPPREGAIRGTREGLEKLRRPDGQVYGSDYYRHLRATINYIQNLGEGMAMVDLDGLRVEPVVFGIRGLIDQGPLALYFRECLKDLADNHGSEFRGPRSVFYEAQATLRSKDKEAARQRREEIIRYLLSLKDDLNEVILYEAADWVYHLPLSDPDLYGHGFLGR